jgi:MerR family transcriptional regulator, redox-sensitive transcriptional activator SoxR
MVEVKSPSTRSLSVGEVASRAGVATSALRFYEANHLIRSERNIGGHRRYRSDVLRRVGFIKVAQRVGLPLADIRAALDSLPESRTPTRKDWARLAKSWQPILDERIALLVAMKEQLDGCIGCGCLSLDTCTLYNPHDVAATRGAGARYLLGDPPATPATPTAPNS